MLEEAAIFCCYWLGTRAWRNNIFHSRPIYEQEIL